MHYGILFVLHEFFVKQQSILHQQCWTKNVLLLFIFILEKGNNQHNYSMPSESAAVEQWTNGEKEKNFTCLVFYRNISCSVSFLSHEVWETIPPFISSQLDDSKSLCMDLHESNLLRFLTKKNQNTVSKQRLVYRREAGLSTWDINSRCEGCRVEFYFF